MRHARLLLALMSLWSAHDVLAQRQPVLGQINLPHPYYYREMYLPQLTEGPSSLCWSEDGRQLIYSMAGSLWRQNLASNVAEQLTDEPGYDYQPDCSADGHTVIYTQYRANALELRSLDLTTLRSRALTANGAVNVEPRFSADGKRVVFVSTQFHGRFHVFVAELGQGELQNVTRLTGEHQSALPRYYYSGFDHEISPLFARDGKSVILVSNRDHIYGTGGLWRVSAAPGDAAGGKELHYEETNWKARPDLSPDGSRLVYASYLGRSWHNLWLLPAGGGDPFPLTYADYDQTNPRWSPDGRRIAFISNRHGDTEIGIVAVPGGRVEYLPRAERHWRSSMARLSIAISDPRGGPAAARVSVTDDRGRFYAPAGAMIHADDGIDLSGAPFEAHYFHARGESELQVPAGALHVDVLHGFTRALERRTLQVEAGEHQSLSVNLAKDAWRVPLDGHWVSADVHVHMNYGGVYRNTPAHLVEQAEAEDLDFVHSLLVNKEQRFPDIAYNGTGRDPASSAHTLVVHSQEYHTSYWGHLGLLNLSGGIILPGYVGYPNTAAASLVPMNADVADIAHERGAVVGYVHPFDEYPEPLAKPAEPLTSELPVDVALGKVDYLEILGFSDHRATARVWYQLLNLGFHLPAAGGTDAMANFASLRGPVGMNRVYANVQSGEMGASWLAALKAGRTFATNGPLLNFTLREAQVGDELRLPKGGEVLVHAALKSIVPVDEWALVCNGRVVSAFTHRAIDQGEVTRRVPLKESGWCVVRASSQGFRYPVLDNYVYATTSPIYVRIADRKPASPADARYFAAWVQRMIEATARYPDWNEPEERARVLARLNEAKDRFIALELP
jgi:hypothetical protein